MSGQTRQKVNGGQKREVGPLMTDSVCTKSCKSDEQSYKSFQRQGCTTGKMQPLRVRTGAGALIEKKAKHDKKSLENTKERKSEMGGIKIGVQAGGEDWRCIDRNKIQRCLRGRRKEVTRRMKLKVYGWENRVVAGTSFEQARVPEHV